jgi:hypothetical protein
MVWFPHEPWRSLHDLRYDQTIDGFAQSLAENLGRYADGQHRRLADRTQEASYIVIDQVDQLGAPDRIVANSRSTARYLERVYGRKVSDVVYPGVTVSDFVPLEAENDLVVTVGSLHRGKRLRLVLEAVRQLDGVQLCVAGGGRGMEKFTRMAEALGIADRVFILEGLTNREVQVLLARSLAVLFVPVREPFGIVALEALAAGRPLIAAHGGGYAEVLDDSCSFLVPPEPGAIADRIRLLRENPEVAQRMGQAGREKARQYSWDRTASELLGLIEATYQESAPRLATLPLLRSGEPSRTLFGVDYMCGYGEGLSAGHWQVPPHPHGVTDMPALGYYASYSGAVIEEHLHTLQEAGFDFALLHLHVDGAGPGGHELIAAEHIFAIAERDRSPLRFAVQISPGQSGSTELTHFLRLVRHIFARRKNYLHHRDRPLLFVDWTPDLDCDPLRRHVLHDESEGFTRIVSSPQVVTGRFDGRRLSAPLGAAPLQTWEERWREASRDSGAIRTLTISPGHDDSHLPESVRSGPSAVPRGQGAMYRRIIAFVLSVEVPPDLVLVESFNDYHRNTHIEHSARSGRLYLDLSREFIREARFRWDRATGTTQAAA